MLYDCNRIPHRIDRRLTGLAGPDYDATISFGLPLEPEDCQYGKSRLDGQHRLAALEFAISGKDEKQQPIPVRNKRLPSIDISNDNLRGAARILNRELSKRRWWSSTASGQRVR